MCLKREWERQSGDYDRTADGVSAVEMYFLECLSVPVFAPSSAVPPKVWIKETDCAAVHCAVWCFVQPHMAACCRPKLTPHYLHYPTSNEQNIFSTEALVDWYHLCAESCFTLSFSIEGEDRDWIHINLSAWGKDRHHETHIPLLRLVQTPWHRDIVGHQVWCNSVSRECALCLDTGLWCKRGIHWMGVIPCWLELVLVCRGYKKNETSGMETQQLRRSWRAFLSEMWSAKWSCAVNSSDNAANSRNVMRGSVCSHTRVSALCRALCCAKNTTVE